MIIRALSALMVWSFSLAATADAQVLSSTPAPAFDPAASPFKVRSNSLFDLSAPPEGGPHASQIADRPTGDLRPRFHWGLLGSVIPKWSTPVSPGRLYFDNFASVNMSGWDLRIGVVRTRQVGFELGVSLVRKTVSSFTVVDTAQYPDDSARVTYTPLGDLQMTGIDSHLVIPIVRMGERVQLGVLAAGGFAWIHDRPIQKRIEGPPFYSDVNFTDRLDSPPATGGIVRDRLFRPVPLVPNTNYGITTVSAFDISPSSYVWPLMRGQIAADFLLARPLKLRLAAGYHYPGAQALGVDVIYLFRTGRLDAARVQPPSEPGGAAGAPAAPVADRPQVIAPRRSFWGVFGGITPSWWTPPWSNVFEDFEPETPLRGREFRVGVTRGRPLGREFGVSFVRKSWTEFSFVGQGLSLSMAASLFDTQAARIIWNQIEPIQIPGVEFHSFVPIDKIGQRVQLGALLGFGLARVPATAIQKRIDGPPFVASREPSTFLGLPTVPAGGGFVIDERGQLIPVAPGQTGMTYTTAATEISPLGDNLILARAQIAADVLLAAPFKVRFSAGYNHPGAQLFGVEMVYMFGTGR